MEPSASQSTPEGSDGACFGPFGRWMERNGIDGRSTVRSTRSPVPCHHRVVQEPSESVYELLRRGHALLEARHHAQAAVVLERADRLEPNKASIIEALGRAYFNSGQHQRSRETFERLLVLDPSADYAHYALGQSLKQLGRREEAATHLRLAVALSPDTALYRDALARLGPIDADAAAPKPAPKAKPRKPRPKPAP